MTISTITATKQYSGDGSTVSFPTVFMFLANADIQITHRDSSDTETVWVENTQYTLTGAEVSSGGTVTVKTSPTDYTPASGETLTIERVTAETQGTDYPEGGAFPAAAHETAVDRLTMLVQQATAKIARAPKYPVTDASTLSAEHPNSTDRASKFAAWDAAGEPIASRGPTGDSSIPVSSYIETLLDDLNAAAARTTLGVVIGTDVQAELITTRGDMIRGDSSGDTERLALGTSDQVPTSDGTDLAFADVPLSLNYTAGLTLSKSAADTLGIAVGECRDDGDAVNLALTSAHTKDVSSSWVVGTGNGSLDTGSYAASTLYAVWLMRRSDTGVVDVLTSLAFANGSLTKPTNYDQFRLIGFFVTDAGPDILAFTQVGDYFRLTGDVVTDVTDATMTADTFETATLSVPPNCLAHIYATMTSDGDTAADGDIAVRTAGAADAGGPTESVSHALFSATNVGGVGGSAMVQLKGCI